MMGEIELLKKKVASLENEVAILKDYSQGLEILFKNTENALNTLPEVIFFLDKDYNIKRVAGAVKDILGFEQTDLLSKGFLDIAQMDEKEIEAFNKKDFSSPFSAKFKSSKGEDVPTITRATQYTDLDGNILTICACSDIRHSKIAEELNEKVEELNKSYSQLFGYKQVLEESYEEFKKVSKKKDEFVSMVAHELKTPLAAIGGFSELLKGEDIAKNKESREKYLGIITKETERLVKLINEILDLSRIDLGTIKLEIREVDIKEIFQQVIDVESQKAQENGVELKVDVGEDVPKIKTDYERLVQVVLNLVNNAIKFTDDGYIKMSAKKEGNDVLFSVEDTGIGIPAEHFPKMFTRFYQVDSSHSRKVGGTGLGLSIVKEMIELFGGKVWLESQEGKGTTFFFKVPINYSPPEEKLEEKLKKTLAD